MAGKDGEDGRAYVGKSHEYLKEGESSGKRRQHLVEVNYEVGRFDSEASSVTWAVTLEPRGHHKCMRVRETFM